MILPTWNVLNPMECEKLSESSFMHTGCKKTIFLNVNVLARKRQGSLGYTSGRAQGAEHTTRPQGRHETVVGGVPWALPTAVGRHGGRVRPCAVSSSRMTRIRRAISVAGL